MNDLKDLLELALSDGHGPDPAQRPDPSGDLARGRRQAQRRRLRLGGAAAGSAAVVAAVVVPLAVHSAGHTASPHAGQVTRPAASSAPAPTTATAIALVTYDGKQPPGYQVSEVPRGWIIQGGNPYVLTLAPKGDPDTSVDSFVGKLVVMLQSRDASAPTTGKRQPVDGRPGRFDVQGKTQMLTYKDAKGDWVVIQAPTSLGWDSTRLARFAAGVQVLGNAQQSRG